ncbi:MAG: proton-conducting transporter membrane subunit, partial [Aeromicrobium sp.]
AARLFPFYAYSTVVLTAMAVIAGVTMLMGAVFALVQTDLKRALAGSTVSPLAFKVAAISASDPEAGLDHLVSHGVFKALLFLGCGCLMHAVGSSALSAMGGLRSAMPVTFWTATIGFAALAGVVPTAGFFTKDSVLHGIERATDGDGGLASRTAWVLLGVALISSFVTAAYATRLWLKAFFGAASSEGRDAHEAPLAMTGPLIVLAVGTFALSIGQPFHLGIGVLSTAIAAAGIVVVLLMWRRGSTLDWAPAPLAAELGLDRPFSRWIPRLTAGISGAVVDLDRDAVDVYPRGGASLAVLGTRGLAWVQSRNVQRYATVLAAGVLVLVAVGVVVS